MQHAVGLSQLNQEPVKPLEMASRIRFDTDNFHSLGYFSLISPHFDRFAQRDVGISIDSINVLFTLRGNDLTEAIEALTELEAKIISYPAKWKTYLGELHPPNRAPLIRIEPLLFRHRALRIIRQLSDLCTAAIKQGKLVSYGNGVAYRHLCGIKLLPGTIEYS